MLSQVLTLFIALFLALSAVATVPASVEIPQGRVWRLLESGYPQQAELLEKSLEEFLKTQPIHQVAYLGGGISTSYLVRFDHNVFAVMKLSDPYVPNSYLHEVAAYKLDRLLGLHMIPLTVARVLNGQNYSLQLYYPGEGLQTKNENDFQRRRDDLKVFDYLISQGDRPGNTKNTFIAEDGRRIAIDQARVFLPYSPQELQTWNYGQPSDEIKERILNLNEIEVRKTLKGLLSKSQINQVLIRLLELKNDFSKNPPPTKKPNQQKDPWPQMKDEFKLPEKTLQYEFWDYFGVWKILSEQKGKRLTPEALEMIQKNSSSESRRKLLGAIFQRWPNFTTEVKKELLNLLWSQQAVAVLKHYRPTLRDVIQLDPNKEKDILKLDSVSPLKPKPLCSRAHF